MIKVLNAQVQTNYWLKITFNNNEVKFFNVFPYLDKGIFKELIDEEYFKKVSVKFDSIAWPNEQDFSPDTLYLLGKSKIND